MIIALQNYQYFQYTNRLGSFIYNERYRSYRGCCDLAKIIAKIALAILALPFAVVADGCVSLAAFLYRACRRPPQPTPPLPPCNQPAPYAPEVPRYVPQSLSRNEFDQAPAVLQQVGGRPNEALVDRIMERPFVAPRDPSRFFRDAVRLGFIFQDDATIARYRELIAHDGAPADGEEEAPIEIFQWMAGCLVVHQLRARRAHPGENEDLRRAYNALERDRTARSTALLKIWVPEFAWTLSPAAQDLVRRINAAAHEMTRAPSFRDLCRRSEERGRNIFGASP